MSCGWGIAAAVVALLFYYGDERSFMHRGYAEGIFWFCLYAWVAFVLLILPDSPLIQLRLLIQVGGADHVALVLLAGLAGVRTHSLRRSTRMASLMQQLDLQELVRTQAETIPARIAVSRIADTLGAKQTLSALWRRRAQERAILEALRDCCLGGTEDLLYVLNSGDVDLPLLLEVARSPEVLAVLREQLPHMDIVTKAKLIDAMQRQSDFFFERNLQEFVTTVLTRTQKEDLTNLKNLLDEGGDFYNLHKLVFSDLPNDLRELTLRHIKREGSLVRASSPGLLRKVLSDIDDTLYCSGGHFPAGADRRFSKGQLYPGVLALFRELATQPLVGCAGGTAGREAGAEAGHAASDAAGGAGGHAADKAIKQPASFPGSLAERMWASVPWAVGRKPPAAGEPISAAWVRGPGDEWVEVAVSPTDTVADLQSRAAFARPGAGAGAARLARAPEVSFSPPRTRAMSSLVFLSARPHAYKDYLESKSYQLFRRLRARDALHCMPTLLPGQIRSSGGAALRGAVLRFRTPLGALVAALPLVAFAVHRSAAHPQVLTCLVMLCTYVYLAATTQRCYKLATSVWDPVGRDKKRTFVEYRQLYNECDVVYFGDNGQGDLLCAELLADSVEEDEGGPPIASFIHEVVPKDEVLTSLPHEMLESERAVLWKEKRVFFYRTYVGAAVCACKRGLLSREALARVARSAVEDCVRLCAMNVGMTGTSRHFSNEILVKELNKDVEVANSMLPEIMQPIDLVPSSLGAQRGRKAMDSMTATDSVANFAFVTPFSVLGTDG